MSSLCVELRQIIWTSVVDGAQVACKERQKVATLEKREHLATCGASVTENIPIGSMPEPGAKGAARTEATNAKRQRAANTACRERSKVKDHVQYVSLDIRGREGRVPSAC